MAWSHLLRHTIIVTLIQYIKIPAKSNFSLTRRAFLISHVTICWKRTLCLPGLGKSEIDWDCDPPSVYISLKMSGRLLVLLVPFPPLFVCFQNVPLWMNKNTCPVSSKSKMCHSDPPPPHGSINIDLKQTPRVVCVPGNVSILTCG